MTECNQCGFEFAPLYRRGVVAQFDGGDSVVFSGALLRAHRAAQASGVISGISAMQAGASISPGLLAAGPPAIAVASRYVLFESFEYMSEPGVQARRPRGHGDAVRFRYTPVLFRLQWRRYFRPGCFAIFC